MQTTSLLHLLQTHQCKPLIQAPMAGVQNSKLAIAVCQENAIGSLPCAMLSADKIEQEIIKIQQATNTPFNVNFFAHQVVNYDDKIHQKWLNTLQKFYDEFNIDNQNIPLTGARQPFNCQNAELIADLKVPIVSFHFGLPDDDLLNMVKQSGAKILATATTVNEAKFLANKGVDAIIAQGIEAGGHRGMFLDKDLTMQSGTFSLLPNIAKLLKNSDILVIGAGGITDNMTVKSAFGLGADLVQIGTAFLLADECDTKPTHKFLLQSEQSHHTALTNLFSGGVARGMVTQFMRDFAFVNDNVPPFPYASFVLNHLKNNLAQQENNAYQDYFNSFWAGQNAPLAQSGSVKSIIDRLRINQKI